MTIDYTKSPQSPPPPRPPQGPPRSWWSRNWKWVVPVGCLLPVLLVGGCFVGMAVFVFSAIRSSDVYSEALRRAQENPDVIAALGSPIEPKWWLGGNVNVSGESGSASLVIPINGPKGDGAIHVEATKSAGVWNYSKLLVETRGQTINLLEESASPEESPDTASPTG